MFMGNFTSRLTDELVLDCLKEHLAIGIHPTHEKIAVKLDCDRKTVTRSLNRLMISGEIVIDESGHKPRRYKLKESAAPHPSGDMGGIVRR